MYKIKAFVYNKNEFFCKSTGNTGSVAEAQTTSPKCGICLDAASKTKSGGCWLTCDRSRYYTAVYSWMGLMTIFYIYSTYVCMSVHSTKKVVSPILKMCTWEFRFRNVTKTLMEEVPLTKKWWCGTTNQNEGITACVCLALNSFYLHTVYVYMWEWSSVQGIVTPTRQHTIFLRCIPCTRILLQENHLSQYVSIFIFNQL